MVGCKNTAALKLIQQEEGLGEGEEAGGIGCGLEEGTCEQAALVCHILLLTASGSSIIANGE